MFDFYIFEYLHVFVCSVCSWLRDGLLPIFTFVTGWIIDFDAPPFDCFWGEWFPEKAPVVLISSFYAVSEGKSRFVYIDFLFFCKYCFSKLDKLSPAAPLDLMSFFILSESCRLSLAESFWTESPCLGPSWYSSWESTPMGKQNTDWDVSRLFVLLFILPLRFWLLMPSVIAPLELATCFGTGRKMLLQCLCLSNCSSYCRLNRYRFFSLRTGWRFLAPLKLLNPSVGIGWFPAGTWAAAEF